MNKTAIIIGGVALLGVGAYFYFKPKAKDETDTVGAGTSTPTVDKETKSSTDLASNIIIESEAKRFAEEIKKYSSVSYKRDYILSKRPHTNRMVKDRMPIGGWVNPEKGVEEATIKLNSLGYKVTKDYNIEKI